MQVLVFVQSPTYLQKNDFLIWHYKNCIFSLGKNLIFSKMKFVRYSIFTILDAEEDP